MFLAIRLTPPSESSFALRLAGDPGVEYVGYYRLYRDTGYYDQFDLRGAVPTELQMRGTTVYARVVRQPQSRGALDVQVLRDGRVVDEAQTVAPDGLVEVTASMPEGD